MFDVILFRNVSIYWSDDHGRRVMDAWFRICD